MIGDGTVPSLTVSQRQYHQPDRAENIPALHLSQLQRKRSCYNAALREQLATGRFEVSTAQMSARAVSTAHFAAAAATGEQAAVPGRQPKDSSPATSRCGDSLRQPSSGKTDKNYQRQQGE